MIDIVREETTYGTVRSNLLYRLFKDGAGRAGVACGKDDRSGTMAFALRVRSTYRTQGEGEKQ